MKSWEHFETFAFNSTIFCSKSECFVTDRIGPHRQHGSLKRQIPQLPKLLKISLYCFLSRLSECLIQILNLFCLKSEWLCRLDTKYHITRNNMTETVENETVQRQLGTLRTSPMKCSTKRNNIASSNANCDTNEFFRRGTRI